MALNGDSNARAEAAPGGIDAFRAAVKAYEDEVRDRIGASNYLDSVASERRRLGGKLRNELLADSLDGLDLTPREWQLMRWFLSWDEQDVLAAIISKARATPTVPRMAV